MENCPISFNPHAQTHTQMQIQKHTHMHQQTDPYTQETALWENSL